MLFSKTNLSYSVDIYKCIIYHKHYAKALRQKYHCRVFLILNFKIFTTLSSSELFFIMS